MNYERKYNIVKKQLDKTIERVSSLQQRNECLQDENEHLRVVLSEKEEKLEEQFLKYESLQADLNDSINEIRECKNKYNDLVLSVLKIKKQYEKEINKLLKQLKKHAK